MKFTLVEVNFSKILKVYILRKNLLMQRSEMNFAYQINI